ncbi:MAG: hypothetical protein ACI4JK_07320 [Oscillospiraceae bacterium]
MKTKKVMCAIISAAMCLSTLTSNVLAEENVIVYENTFSIAAPNCTPVELTLDNGTSFDLGGYNGVLPNADFVEDSECSIKARSNTFTKFDFTGTINSDDDVMLYGPIVLAPNQICQAQLYGPSDTSLNYILALYELDPSNAISSVVTYSDFNNANTRFQSVSTVNTTESSVSYAIGVLSNAGYSATDTFDLHISLGAGFSDIYEPNDCARNATTATLTNVEASQYFTLSASLNSPYDTDWFDLIVPSDADFDTLTLVPQSGAGAIYMEMFTVSNGTLVKQNANGNTYPISVGHNYLRISSNYIYDESFTETNYAVQIFESPNAIIDDITLEIFMNNGEVPTQNYSSNGLRMALRGGSTFSCRVTYKSNGIIYTLADDTVSVDLYNRAWSVGAPSYHCYNSANSSNGISYVSVTSPQVRGEHSGVSNMRYDSSCHLTITSSTFGELLDAPIYITSRIMS